MRHASVKSSAENAGPLRIRRWRCRSTSPVPIAFRQAANPKDRRARPAAGGELAVEGIDHLHAIEITVAAGKGAQRKLIQTRHFGPPNMFWARATSRSARSRSDSARATARPKLVRW